VNTPKERSAKVKSDRRSITYFYEKGKHNTLETLEIVKKRAHELAIKHVTIATSHAFTPVLAADVFKDSNVELVAVGLSASYREKGWDLTEEETEKIISCGIRVCKNMHVFSGGLEEAFLGGMAIQNIVGSALSIFSQGMKVCVETSIMAAESGLIPIDNEIIAVAGTDGGADTAIVLRPNYARKFKKIQVLEILCKPRTPFL
jgi:hypothetical protein